MERLSYDLVPIMPCLGNAETGKAGAIERTTPGGEFFGAQPVSLASLFFVQQSAVDRSQYLGLSAAYPMSRAG